MATAKAEKFDAEMFAKLVALFDSNNAGEADNAFRKTVLMCAKKGLRFCDAAGMVFGQGDGAEVAALQEQLRRQEAEHADQLTEAAAEVERLRGEVAELRAQADAEMPEGEHVIDLPGRLRRAWTFAQFRLLVLTATLLAIAETAEELSDNRALVRLFWVLCLFLFGAWSVAEFRKRGGLVVMKWIVYGASLIFGILLADSIRGENRPAAIFGIFAAALVLTLSRLSELLGEKLRAHVWESKPVRAVRRWF